MGRSVLFLLLMVSASQAMSGDSDDDAKSGERKRRYSGDISQAPLPIKKRFGERYIAIQKNLSNPKTNGFRVAKTPDLILHDGTSDTSYNSMPPLVPIRQGIASTSMGERGICSLRT